MNEALSITKDEIDKMPLATTRLFSPFILRLYHRHVLKNKALTFQKQEWSEGRNALIKISRDERNRSRLASN